MKLLAGLLLVAFVSTVTPRQAAAVPLLQLYVEGATYNSTSETWEIDLPSTASFRVWTIGNVAGPGGKGTLYDVKLAVSWAAAAGFPTFTANGTTAGGVGSYGGYDDPSAASDPTQGAVVTDGSTPTLGDGSSLPSHGQFGAGIYWSEWSLGNFDKTDSQIEDFSNAFPTAPATTTGQINVYEISVIKDLPGVLDVHFDAYGYYEQVTGKKVKQQFVNAPFSHDASVKLVPEPATLVSWSALAVLAMAGATLRNRRRR